jgi:hypothetical protein
MKKYILALTFSIITIGAFAQTIKFGLKAGINTLKFVSDDSSYSTTDKYSGFNFGGIVDIGFGAITIQPGLLFITNSRRDHARIVPGGTINNTPQVKYYLSYLQVPVNLLINFTIAKPIKMQLGGGPYFALKTGNDANTYNTYKDTDAGANLFAGFVLCDRYLLNAQYGFGLSDIGGDLQLRVMSLSVGYLFK